MIHGVSIVPNDINLIVDPRDYEKAKEVLQDLLTGETEIDTQRPITPFRINDIHRDIIGRGIDESLVEKVNFHGISIPVYTLKTEYEYYKKRTIKTETTKKSSLLKKL